jgi:hypothetical protein
MRSASAFRFSKGCSSLNLDRIMTNLMVLFAFGVCFVVMKVLCRGRYGVVVAGKVGGFAMSLAA